MKKSITYSEYLQLLGLFSLARMHNDDLARVDKAAHQMLDISGDASTLSDHIGDEMYGDCRLDWALEKMGVTVDKAADDVFPSGELGPLPAKPEAAPLPPAIFTEDTLPPMSFQEAKTLLHSHTEREGYLEQALRELNALKTTKSIKQASAAHLKKAANDFDSRKKWKVRG